LTWPVAPQRERRYETAVTCRLTDGSGIKQTNLRIETRHFGTDDAVTTYLMMFLRMFSPVTLRGEMPTLRVGLYQDWSYGKLLCRDAPLDAEIGCVNRHPQDPQLNWSWGFALVAV
jgi:hypothetical protein